MPALTNIRRVVGVGTLGLSLILGGLGAAPTLAASVSITVRCYGNPETTTIHNGTSHRITINSVGSTYQPRSNEPFYVYHRLSAGHSITYQTGYAAHSNVLTHQYIYNNNGLDGARAKTSVGTFKKHC